MPVLYIVATPIGNLKDFTYRAVEVLNEVDLIFCEDTRVSARLLNHYNIKKPLKSLHSNNEEYASLKVLNLLKENKDIAYLTDAGTPLISDPGKYLVSLVRQNNFTIVPIPGPSALTTILSVNHIRGKTIAFEGFLEKKSSKRITKIKNLLDTVDIVIIYESPYRLVKLLLDLDKIEECLDIIVGRELTKKFEEIRCGSCGELIKYFENQNVKGELTLLIAKSK